jgi:hypothetical protein
MEHLSKLVCRMEVSLRLPALRWPANLTSLDFSVVWPSAAKPEEVALMASMIGRSIVKYAPSVRH